MFSKVPLHCYKKKAAAAAVATQQQAMQCNAMNLHEGYGSSRL